MQSATAAWIAAASMLALVLFSPAVLNDGDTFSHIATGQWMIANGAIPAADPFSLTHAGAAWVAHEWLAELLLAGAFRAAGWAGVVVLTAAAAAAAMFLLARFLSTSLSAGIALAVAFLAASCITPEMLARPHILALPVFVAWVTGVVGAADRSRPPSWRLLPLMSLWANLHGGFIIGLALTIPLAAEAVLQTPAPRRHTVLRWIGFLAAATAASLLTPHGPAGLLLPFKLAGVPELAHVGEWQPTDFASLQPLELLILLGLYLGLGRGLKLPPVRLLIVLGLLHMALRHARHLLLLGVIVPALAAAPLAAAWPPPPVLPRRLRVAAAGLATSALLVAARLLLPAAQTAGPPAPTEALAHVPAALRARPVFNDYGFGGYLIFAHVRPFIDARVELYGSAAMRQYAVVITPDRTALVAMLHDNAIAWTILSPANPAVPLLDMLPGWCRLYADNQAVIHHTDCTTPRP